ncbi:hypothetical protein [Bosea sp. (in: a-proteobacteria)]|uniref:hypothetical protein n=1 Tax=Bosea sp. (in: a-proteobacteria) TaxID=1871050 RepID=UPI002605949F|nr:hypothetical protein [Bosea sp. (in: a-proteobacteria)]MCO5089716.1 hypothetical protein [Bosea sp. (in: a-proteobacteria)]
MRQAHGRKKLGLEPVVDPMVQIGKTALGCRIGIGATVGFVSGDLPFVVNDANDIHATTGRVRCSNNAMDHRYRPMGRAIT